MKNFKVIFFTLMISAILSGFLATMLTNASNTKIVFS